MAIIGIFGGTFNPIHWGHLRTALELKKMLAIDPMIFIPAGMPPHRESPEVDALSRLQMVEVAVQELLASEADLADLGEFKVDDREINRSGPSYTVDTLRTFRKQYSQRPICFIVGADAFVKLNTWHEWQSIFELSHLIVVHRPGWSLEEIDKLLPEELRSVVLTRSVTDKELLTKQPSGLIYCLNVTEIDISSSELRHKIAQGEPVNRWLPESVIRIIDDRHLYRTES